MTAQARDRTRSGAQGAEGEAPSKPPPSSSTRPGASRSNRWRWTLPARTTSWSRSRHSGISTGTEKLFWSGRMPPFPGMGYPLIPGYEAVGEVVEAGPESGRRAGEHVFVPGATATARCAACSAARSAALVTQPATARSARRAASAPKAR